MKTVCLVAALTAAISTSAFAQSDGGPVRLVRFVWSEGGPIQWRPDANSAWSDAAPNLPVRQGAQIWTPSGVHAEMMFDDGTVMRLTPDSSLTLQTLSSDSNGEFTELKLDNGHLYLRAPHGYSTYQVDTPYAAIDANGPARFQVTSSDHASLYQYSGQSTVQNDSGTVTISEGQDAEIPDASSQPQIASLPQEGAFAHFNDSRDAIIFAQTPHVPPNIGLVCGGLNQYGHWTNDPNYGWIWRPSESASWTPYSQGHWVFVNPYGWTWVGAEAWGWAPYHYGTWVHGGYGWAWAPGPAQQYWSPAVVNFTYSGGAVCWAPLAPREVHYPAALSIGFSSGNWSLYFSIGGAAVYSPAAGGGYCEPHPWNNGYVNRTTTIVNVTNIYNRTTIVDNHFVPQNARFGGAVTTSLSGFQGGGGHFQRMGSGAVQAFQRGKTLSAGNGTPVFGPPAAKPTARSFTVGRSFSQTKPSPAAFSRIPTGSQRGSFHAGSPAVTHPGQSRPGVTNPGQRTGGNRNQTTTPNGRPGGSSNPRTIQRPGGSPNPIRGHNPNQPVRGWGQNRGQGQSQGQKNPVTNPPQNRRQNQGQGRPQGQNNPTTNPAQNRRQNQGQGQKNPVTNPPQGRRPNQGNPPQQRGGAPANQNPRGNRPNQNAGGPGSQPPRGNPGNPNRGGQPNRNNNNRNKNNKNKNGG